MTQMRTSERNELSALVYKATRTFFVSNRLIPIYFLDTFFIPYFLINF